MNFSNSLLPSFKIWRLFGLSPFTLNENSPVNFNRYQKLFHVIVSLTFILLTIPVFRIHFLVTNSLHGTDLWIQVWLFFGFFLIYTSSNISLIESFIKRNSQIKWLIHLRSIDSYMIDKIGIQIDYTNESLQHSKRIRRWYTVYSLISVFLLPAFCTRNVCLMFSGIFATIADFIVALRFHQFTTYVDMIQHRYFVLNKFINKIYVNDLNLFARREGLFAVAHVVRIMDNSEIDPNWQPVDKFKLIDKLEHVSNLLVEANQQLNRLFPVSLTACVFMQSFDLICSNYFIFEGAVISGAWFVYLAGIIQLLPRGNNIVSIGNASEDAAEEVERIFLNIILFIALLE